MENIGGIFGKNVFNDGVMKARLPKETYKEVRRAIDEGKRLDISVANVVANAMKDWAVENGATHFTHWFQPMTGVTAEKTRQFYLARKRRLRDYGIFRQRTRSRRTGRLVLSLGRLARHVRSARLHRVGPYFVRLYQRRRFVYSHRVLFVRRRGAG